MSAAGLGGLLLALVAATPRGAQEEPREPAAALAGSARTLFEASCVRCHGPEKAKARLRLDRLTWDPADEQALETWQAVLDRIQAGEMPPEDEPRPDPAAVAHLERDLAAAFAALAGEGPRVLRRLNRTQYRNTLRDLLAIDVALEDPTSSFPPDGAIDGFDGLAEGLVMSDFLLSQHLLAARRALDMALFTGPRPEPRTYALYDAEGVRDGNFTVSDGRLRGHWNLESPRPEDGPVCLFLNDERAIGETLGQTLTTSRGGAPFPGWYDFRFEVESKGRGNLPPKLLRPLKPEWQQVHPEDLHRLELYFSAPAGTSPVTGRRRILAEALDLADDERVVIERRYWLPRGWRLELAFGNAYAGHLDYYVAALGGEEDALKLRQLTRAERSARMIEITYPWILRSDAPRILVHAASESGPHYPSWPPPSHVAVLGDPAAPLAERLATFATRAFRRPVTPEELGPHLRLAEESPEGLRTALEAILCAPRFLYFLEGEGALDDWALAARLSYFLWSTLPDAELLALAAAGRLVDPAVLRAQAERLLADPRSSEFVAQFTWSWLGFQNMLDMAPDPVRFPEFHAGQVGSAAVTESRLFFRELLDGNRPLSEFLGADHTFVNSALARLYGIEGVHTSARFERVALPAELRRGGLLGQAAVLTASANGVDTSPVVRGVWVLERLLGMPPDPPPPDIPIPEPDTRGAKSIREIFEQHRSIESCNECHRSIDPLGFALESFDAIGRWRVAYESGVAIDPSGQMPNGTTFTDIEGLKRAMLADVKPFARNLAGRLAAYAAGRELRPADRPELDRLVAAATAPGAGLRDLVLGIVTSRLFRER